MYLLTAWNGKKDGADKIVRYNSAMLLVIDAGNSNVTFGVYEADALRVHWRLRTEAGRTADEYAALLHTLFSQAGLTFADIGGICLASVVPAITPDLMRLGHTAFGQEPWRVSGASDLGLDNAYEPPGDVGADRLVDAVAAVQKYGAPCIVIDFGTATTFNAVAAPAAAGGRPIYLGGAICLGIGVSLEALFSKAAKIPRIALEKPPRAIGGNTIHALQSGILFGSLAQIDGIVARFRAEMDAPNCPVVATGGLAGELIARESRTITAVEPLLTLDGLRLVFEHHRRGTMTE